MTRESRQTKNAVAAVAPAELNLFTYDSLEEGIKELFASRDDNE